jgi:3-oxoacyl-[acyl-carrier protein] reductase
VSPTAIVTGGSREVAEALADRGYGVVVVYLRRADAPLDALAIRADITDELDVARLFEETLDAFGGVDALVHTAARDTAVIDRHAARHLRRGGAIVNVSSTGAIAPELVEQLRRRDITVNGLAPGLEPPGADHRLTDLIAFLDRWKG